MPRAITASLLVVLGLALSGCAIGDGIAHAVKKTAEAFSGDDKPARQAPAATAQAAPERAAPPVDVAPPPPPAAAPTRNSVSVESLPPP